MNRTKMTGCAAAPLAAYLKALGVFRILGSDRKHTAGFWSENAFVLESSIDAKGLVDFFLNQYVPTPVVAPWNGGSGFFSKDNRKAIELIESSKGNRLRIYRETIQSAHAAIKSLGLKEKPEKEEKQKLLLRCRNTFPEPALEWLDSAFALTDDGAKYPPLLGTGGNDGRLEFTNNFMQRLTEVFDLQTGEPMERCQVLLENALFGTPVKGLSDVPIGQFSPAAGGGANASTGFDAKSAVNPWDFILAIEGAILLAAAAVRKLEGGSPGQLVYPFCVQPSGSGYGSSTDADENEARCEIWMPLWSNPCGLNEIRTLFSDGRAWVGRRPAKTGVDFAMAVASLGVDRGIREFQRFGFHVRNGLAYFATPLQRLTVRRDNVIADLLAPCDAWISRFLPKAKSDTAPGSIRRAARRLEGAILGQISNPQKNPETAQELLIALGECERTLANAERWREESFVGPIPSLLREWVQESNTATVEMRLAAALASTVLWSKSEAVPLRRHLEAVKVIPGAKGWVAWNDDLKNEVIATGGRLVDSLCQLMRRRLLMAKAAGWDSWNDFSKLSAWPSDIAAFIEGRIDEKRFVELLWGFSLVDFSGEAFTGVQMPARPVDDSEPPAFYAQLKMCFGHLPGDKKIPIEPNIFNLAAAGDGERASKQALRRLYGSSIPITHVYIPLAAEASRRSAAALLFPLWDTQLAMVGRTVAPDFFPDNRVSSKNSTP